MNILAPDLGKSNTVCCFVDSAPGKHRLLTAATEPTYLATVLKIERVD